MQLGVWVCLLLQGPWSSTGCEVNYDLAQFPDLNTLSSCNDWVDSKWKLSDCFCYCDKRTITTCISSRLYEVTHVSLLVFWWWCVQLKWLSCLFVCLFVCFCNVNSTNQIQTRCGLKPSSLTSAFACKACRLFHNCVPIKTFLLTLHSHFILCDSLHVVNNKLLKDF